MAYKALIYRCIVLLAVADCGDRTAGLIDINELSLVTVSALVSIRLELAFPAVCVGSRVALETTVGPR